ncbi:hypothetical protein [Pedobacter suwonensis]|uniref:hypothetical protein n=1 Tax=Pedobacter suwonensis TaxID=332999 RepID=UPI003CFD4B8B
MLSTVGFGDVLQQTPWSVTGDPPLSVITPPLMAEVVVIFVKLLVVIVAMEPFDSVLGVVVSATFSVFLHPPHKARIKHATRRYFD